jgi:hypothetical protein
LLIGIGRYLPGQNFDNLDGPVNDVESMAAVLTTDFGFRPSNVRILRDSQASRAAILAALDELIARVAPGDYVFFYYSGHGTSPQDVASRNLPIDGDTGAIIPADFRRGTPAEVAQRLVVGRRDLRPRLAQLDRKATVFAILDTCFSANLMRGVQVSGKSKGQSLGRLVEHPKGSMEDDIRQDLSRMTEPAAPAPYPYNTVAWISAALAGQSAVDIDAATVRANPSATIDGKPHGQLTDALLAGLRGVADRNHDNVITHAELYEYAVGRSLNWSHQPSWSADESNRDLPNMPVFGGRVTALSGSAHDEFNGTIRVRLQGAAIALAPRFRAIPTIKLVKGDADLVVRPEAGGYRLYQSGGVPINDKPLNAAATVTRAEAEPEVQRLIAWHHPAQRSNLDLSLWQEGARARRGFFLAGQEFELKLSSDRRIYPLVVNVDVAGQVTVLYPRPGSGGTDPVTAGQLASLGVDGVSCRDGCGIEFLKAFAFEQKPVGYESWVEGSFPASDPKLRRLVAMASQGLGETTIRVITNAKH